MMAFLLEAPPFLGFLGLLGALSLAALAFFFPQVEAWLLSVLLRRRSAREARFQPRPRVGLRGPR